MRARFLFCLLLFALPSVAAAESLTGTYTGTAQSNEADVIWPSQFRMVFNSNGTFTWSALDDWGSYWEDGVGWVWFPAVSGSGSYSLTPSGGAFRLTLDGIWKGSKESTNFPGAYCTELRIFTGSGQYLGVSIDKNRMTGRLYGRRNTDTMVKPFRADRPRRPRYRSANLPLRRRERRRALPRPPGHLPGRPPATPPGRLLASH